MKSSRNGRPAAAWAGADGGAVGAVGADEAGEGDHPRVGEEFARLADAPDVFGAVGGGEAQVAAEAVADVVAVQSVRGPAGVHERLLQRGRDGAFAAAGQAGEPNGRPPLPHRRAAVGGGDRAGVPRQIVRFHRRFHCRIARHVASRPNAY